MSLPVFGILSHELRDDGEDGQSINGKNSINDGEFWRNVKVEGLGSRRLGRYSFGRGEIWQRCVGRVESKGPGIVDGNVDVQGLIEVRM